MTTDSKEAVRQFVLQWQPVGRDEEVIETAKLTATLRQALEEVKKVTSSINATNLVSFKESAMQMSTIVKKLEMDKTKRYKEITQQPENKTAIDDFITKTSVILGAQNVLNQKKSLQDKSRPSSLTNINAPGSPVNTPTTSAKPPGATSSPTNSAINLAGLTKSNSVGAILTSTASIPPPSPLSNPTTLVVSSPNNSRPASAGELKRNESSKLETELETLVSWVSRTLSIVIPRNNTADIANAFKTGAIFCQLINAFFPNTILTIHTINPRQYHCIENLRAFLTACQQKLGLSETMLFEPLEIYTEGDNAVTQISNTLKAFVFAIKGGNEKPQKPSGHVSKPSLPQNPLHKIDHSVLTSSIGSLPSSFVYLKPALETKQSIFESVNSKLASYKMAVAIDEEGNVFRCVDAQTKRVTVQRIEFLDTSLKQVEALAQFLHKADHPYVMNVSAYWFEMGYIYFEIPCYSHCTLKEWLTKQSPTPVEIQDMFSKVLCGLAFLHEHGFVHGRLTLDGIVVGQRFLNNIDTYYPIICGLGQPPDLSHEANSQYRANAVISDHLDIWLLGSAIYESISKQPVKYPVGKGKKLLSYPSFTGIKDGTLVSALMCMLHYDPHRRCPAASLLLHPYFSKCFLIYSGAPFKDLLEVYKTISDYKFQSLPLKGPLILEVERGKIAEDGLTHFSYFEAPDLIREVTFAYSNPSSDSPLLSAASKNSTKTSSEIMGEIWKALLFNEKYFEGFLYNRMVYLLPSRQVKDLEIFRLLGLFVFKSLFDKKRIPSSIALLSSNVLRWSRLGYLDNLSKNDPAISEFARAVISSYGEQLKAFREGLITLDVFTNVSQDELLAHSCGPDEFTSTHILSRVQFYDFQKTSPTPPLIKEFVESLATKDLRRFLMALSSQCSLQILNTTAHSENTLGFTEQELTLKFVKKKTTSSSGRNEIERTGCAVVDMFEFDDGDDLANAFASLMKSSGN